MNEECRAFVQMVKKTVPRSYIRNISNFYPNVRKCAYSNEGRVYMDIDKPVIGKTGYELAAGGWNDDSKMLHKLQTP